MKIEIHVSESQTLHIDLNSKHLSTPVMNSGTERFRARMDKYFGKRDAELVRATHEWLRIQDDLDARKAAIDTGMNIDVSIKEENIVFITHRNSVGVILTKEVHAMDCGQDWMEDELRMTFGEVTPLIMATPEWKRIEYELDARFASMEAM